MLTHAYELVSLLLAAMTSNPGSLGTMLAIAGLTAAVFALHLITINDKDGTTAYALGIADKERAGSRRILRQRDPDGAGHTRSRAPSLA